MPQNLINAIPEKKKKKKNKNSKNNLINTPRNGIIFDMLGFTKDDLRELLGIYLRDEPRKVKKQKLQRPFSRVF